MAIHGRGFPQGTQYLFSPQQAALGSVALAGNATLSLDATGTMTQVTTTVAPVTLAAHRFRYTIEPAPQDFESVQRHLQRMSDEIAQSVNPVRSIADGGTGIEEVTVGALVTGKTANSMETVPIGAVGYVLTSTGTMPSWQPLPAGTGGEANTATNVGVGGIGLVSGKVGVDLQFRSINSVNTKLTAALDAANKKVDLTINEANMALGSMGGSLVIGQIPNSLITYAKIQNVATDRLLGRDTAGAGVVEEIPAAGSLVFTGGPGLQLSGDSAAPGNTKLYGTDGAGVKGWYAQPGAGSAFLRHAAADQTVAADASGLAVNEYEIVAGFTTEIAALAGLQIA